MVSSLSYEKILADFEELSQMRPMDTPTVSAIEKIASKFFQEMASELKRPIFQKIAQYLKDLCVYLIPQTGSQRYAKIDNLIQGMRFLIALRQNEEPYLKLGSLYEHKQIQNAEEYAKEYALNPTYAMTLQEDEPTTAIARACKEGDTKVVQSLAPKVDLNFAISNSQPSARIFPAFLAVLIGHTLSEQKIELLKILKKYTFNPFLRNHEDWWLLQYFRDNRNLYKKPPEILHALLEVAQDLAEASRSLFRGHDSLLDRSICSLQISLSFISRHSRILDYQDGCIRNTFVMASHGIPRYLSQNSRISSLKVRGKVVDLEDVEKMHQEEKRKLEIVQQKCLNAMHAVLDTCLDVDTTSVITSYVVLSERSLRILTARACFKRIFGYAPA